MDRVKFLFSWDWTFDDLNLTRQLLVGSLYLPTNILLIAFFNYYYTFLQLDPDDVSEQLKRQGASFPLVRPGKSTAAFIKTVISTLLIELRAHNSLLFLVFNPSTLF